MFAQRFNQFVQVTAAIAVMLPSTGAFAQKTNTKSGSSSSSSSSSNAYKPSYSSSSSTSTSNSNKSSTSNASKPSVSTTAPQAYRYSNTPATKPAAAPVSKPATSTSSGGNPPSYRMTTPVQAPAQQKPATQTSSAELRTRTDAAAVAELARRQKESDDAKARNAARNARPVQSAPAPVVSAPVQKAAPVQAPVAAQKPVSQTSSAELRTRNDAAARAELARREGESAKAKQTKAAQKAVDNAVNPGNAPKYASAEERKAAKEERKALRDAGFSTTTTQTIQKKDGTTTTVRNTSGPNGKTVQDVKKYDQNGVKREDKKVVTQYVPGTHAAAVTKRVTDFNANGYVKKVTQERGVAFRNSSQYKGLKDRETSYYAYGQKYKTIYSNDLFAQHGFRGGYYYELRPVLTVDAYFYNPLITWLYVGSYDELYYRSFWGDSYVTFDAFKRAGVFFPTRDLVELAEEAKYFDWFHTANFRMSMSVLVDKIESQTGLYVGYNDVVITHQEVISENMAIVEGYVNNNRGALAFKALLDFNSPYSTVVFVPRKLVPTMSDLTDLTIIESRVASELERMRPAPAPAPVSVPASAGQITESKGSW